MTVAARLSPVCGATAPEIDGSQGAPMPLAVPGG